MKSKLSLVCVLGCFLATRVEGVDKFQGPTNGGALAHPGEFQYVVGIARFHETGSPAFCTGSIIGEKFVLTAAHCLAKVVKEYDDTTYASEFADSWVFVYANTTNFVKDMIESWSGENRTTSLTTRRAVKAYFVSKYFTAGVADIAILELESPLNLNDGYHQKLELPSGRKNSYKGVHAVLAGFGKDKDDTSVNPGSLKKAHFRVVPYSKCQHYPRAELYRQNSMCLISVTKDNKHPDRPLGACDDVSGSPLVHGNTVIGIRTSVAAASCDGRARYPQMFAKVEYYKDFINNVIGNLGSHQSITEFKFKVVT